MAAELRRAIRQRPQDSDQMLHANGVVKNITLRALAVKLAPVSDLFASTPKRHAKPGADFGNNAPGQLTTVDVLMRVDMSRSASQESLERLELAHDLGS